MPCKSFKRKEYGLTIISLDEDYRERMNRALLHTQIVLQRYVCCTKLAAKHGSVWSPYPTPNLIEQDLQAVLRSICFVDKIIFGRTNYSKAVNAYLQHNDFYNKKAHEVIRFCEENGIAYHIKEKTITESK